MIAASLEHHANRANLEARRCKLVAARRAGAATRASPGRRLLGPPSHLCRRHRNACRGPASRARAISRRRVRHARHATRAIRPLLSGASMRRQVRRTLQLRPASRLPDPQAHTPSLARPASPPDLALAGTSKTLIRRGDGDPRRKDWGSLGASPSQVDKPERRDCSMSESLQNLAFLFKAIFAHAPRPSLHVCDTVAASIFYSSIGVAKERGGASGVSFQPKASLRRLKSGLVLLALPQRGWRKSRTQPSWGGGRRGSGTLPWPCLGRSAGRYL